MLDVFHKKQMYVSVIMGKENASEDWNYITTMFLTSFNICFVFAQLFYMCRPVTRRGPRKFFAVPGNMCWTSLKNIGYSSKNLGHS